MQHLLSLSLPKQKATAEFSLALRKATNSSSRFVVSRYYHSVTKEESRGCYGNGSYFSDLTTAIHEFREEADSFLKYYSLYPEILETRLEDLPNSSTLCKFELEMEQISKNYYPPIYLVQTNTQVGDRRIQVFVVASEVSDSSFFSWQGAIDRFRSQIDTQVTNIIWVINNRIDR